MTETTDSFSINVRIYYEDTDFGGVVYYANYLKFMERARTEKLRSLGFDQGTLLTGFRRQFVVRSAELKYVVPARFDDVLQVTADLAEVRRASVRFEQRCTVWQSVSGTPAGTLVASGIVSVACVDADSFKPCAIPGSLKMGLNR